MRVNSSSGTTFLNIGPEDSLRTKRILSVNGEKTYESSASASVFNADNKTISYWEQRINNLDRKKDYLFTGYIFSDMIVSDNGGAAVFVEFYDRDGHLIRTYRTDYVKGEQEDWTEFSMKLSFPENCYSMIVKAALVKSVGTAYFDEFSLVDFDSEIHTAELGKIENLNASKIDGAEISGIDDGKDTATDSKDADGSMPIYIWFIIGGAVLVLAAAVIFFVLKKKK